MATNFWKQHESTFFFALYAYIDTKEHLADSIFRQMQLRIRKEAVMDKHGSPYLIIFCWVKKKNAENFKTAMGELKKKLLIFGYRDYPDICDDLAGILGA